MRDCSGALRWRLRRRAYGRVEGVGVVRVGGDALVDPTSAEGHGRAQGPALRRDLSARGPGGASSQARACKSAGVVAVPVVGQVINRAWRGPMWHRHDPVRRALVHSRPLKAGVSEALDRALDLAIAIIGLIVTAPLMAIAAILVAAERKGPVLFAHTRIGKDGKAFQVLKFRSMCMNGEDVLEKHLASNAEARLEWQMDHKLRNDPRVSRLGSVLRKSSVDELPQLINVLRGEMSIVGPRPITNAEVEKYGALFPAYCSVRPGLTGIWQVSGRNDVSYQRRVEMDALYARKKSVLLDLKLILATIPAILSRNGSY